MKDIKLTKDGDISFTNGKIDMVDGIDQLSQNISVALSTPKGSFLDYKDYGLNMDFVINGFDREAGLVAVRECILSVGRVTAVNNLRCELDKEHGIATFFFSVNSTIGNFDEEQEVAINAFN
ncbi:DUF2634 domain-containing protein [Apilactobacillus timberlakei]|uniref:DUF2634 domain-containing protein n=1 Tax=Apilactobacillus timberlakei TaxID=2008380 RepID=UPI001129BD4D|nr:DUF2634 domain-containing protein [Apilactobacillus timberlakei]TPR16636.1 DUF2634 domain-containing protein [Apilactobacillus timberlakei]